MKTPMPLIERAFSAKIRFLANPADIFEKPAAPELTGIELGRAQVAAFRAFTAGRKKR